MTDHDFWMAIRQALLTLVDAVERTKLNYGQPRLQERGQADPITKRIKPTTSDLRKEWKDANR